jgi:serine/threonine-protein kinase RsbW
MCASLVNQEKTASSSATVCLDRLEPHSGRLSISSVQQLPALLADVSRAMERVGYGVADNFAVRLALEEAVVNAVKHGHGHDPRKQVRIWWAVTASAVRLVVEDQGPGFDPSGVPDPCVAENLQCPCGRGLLLINTCMTWVRFNRRGNIVAMCRYRSKPGSSPGCPESHGKRFSGSGE